MGEGSTSSSRETPTVVVGIGCSSGTLEETRLLLGVLPSRSGMAFVLVPSNGAGRLQPELLQPQTNMPVIGVTSSVDLASNHVYVIPPGFAICPLTHKLEARSASPGDMRWPIDELFRSLAHGYDARSAGILLGLGEHGDGAAGLTEIRGSAGLTLVHSSTLAQRADTRTVPADDVWSERTVSLDDMPPILARFAELTQGGAASPGDDLLATDAQHAGIREDDELARITSLVSARSGFDIDAYKTSTLERRVRRRMALAGLGRKADYLALLQRDSHECQRLLGDLRIGVTGFYRDPGGFEALRATVTQSLIERAQLAGSLRVWVAGCATGEEAYSLAILLLEVFNELPDAPSLQVFATDIDHDALSIARAGVYPESAVACLPGELGLKYFTRVDDGKLKIRPRVRDAISFATHDLCSDPPFSRMDLVSCRNVLIYLKAPIQRAVLRAVHFALLPTGHLWLGTSESAGSDPQLFQEVSQKWRIYRKREASRELDASRSVQRQDEPELRALTYGKRGVDDNLAGVGLVQAALARTHAPLAVVVSEQGEILNVRGNLHAELGLAADAPHHDFWSLLGSSLGPRIRSAGFRARLAQRLVKLRVSVPDGPMGDSDIEVTLSPAPEVSPGALTIAFETKATLAAPTPGNLGSEPQRAIEHLQRELAEARDELRITTLDLEATTEEVRAANEESSSINEELQAANEELEASSEELRSLNEELTTLNIELKSKLAQLELINDDLSNFFGSTRLATLFLSPEGRIRRFTPAAHDLLAVLPEDLGRPVTELTHELLQANLDADASLVLRELVPTSRDLQTSDRRWMVRQTLPYRTSDRRIAGVVVTFQDVTDFKRTEALLRRREAQQSAISALGLKALEVRDLGDYLDHALREVQRMLGTDCCCILELQPGTSQLVLRAGLGWKSGLLGRTTVPARANLEPGAMLRSREPGLVSDLSEQPDFEPQQLLVDHGLRSCLSCVIHSERGVYGLLGAYHEATDRFTADDATFLQAIANVVGSTVAARQADLRTQLEQATNRLLAEPGNVLAVSTRVLVQLCRLLGAGICELWHKDVGSERLTCEGFEAPLAPGRRDELRAKLVLGTLQPGVGLIGRTWSEHRAQWLASVDMENERGHALRSLGLTEGIAFPIVANHQTLGVMAFFSWEHLSWDDQTLAMLDKIGRSIGAFVTDRSVAFEQAHLAAIVASSDDAILSKDLNGIVQSWNPGAERIYGYSAAEVLGTPVARLFPEHLKTEADSILERISKGERVESYETVRVRKDGTSIDLSVTISPIRDDAGRVVGASTIARDITEKKRAEKRLEEADRQKDQFLAMLGHELRNPLAAVRNATELLKLQREADPTTTKIREILDRQTRHMAQLMDGLLDVSRIIRNKIDLRFEPVDLGRVVREVVEDYRARPQRYQSQFHLELERNRAWVRGDSVRVTQIVDNLLGNAIKFTGPGGAIFVTLTERYDQVILSVRDTGRGIAPELLPHVFDVFRQAEQSLDRTAGGLGLGLALVKLLTELHGGSVEAASEGPGHGAEFIVRMPAIPAPSKSQVPPLERPDNKFDILVVEDNRDAATLLCELLEVAGHATELAYSAEAAWERLQHRTPQVLLCDLGLPGDMTGFDLARRIRSEARFLPMRIIAVSGYGRPEDKLASRQAGFDAHLTKPVDFDSLQSILTQRAP